MEEQVYWPKGEDEVVRSNSPINHSVQCRGTATNSNTNEKAKRCPAHHRWQRGILGISWKDRVTNEEVRVRTGQYIIDDILSERRLRWLGHLIQMDHQRIPQQALHWEVPGFKRGPGRPRANWRSTVNKDLSRMGITCEEAEVAAQNRSEWHQSVGQCIHLDAG